MSHILGTLHSQAKSSWKIVRYFTIPTRSVPPLFAHKVLVFNSVDKAELLLQHFERIHHLNSNVATANHARIVNHTANKYFSRPHPHVPEAQLTKPYELPTSNSISQNQICPRNRRHLSYYASKSLPHGSHPSEPNF